MKWRLRGVALLAVFAILPLFSPVQPAEAQVALPVTSGCKSQSGAVFCDDFAEGTINASRWLHTVVGNGPTVQQADGRLEVNLPATP